MFYKVFTELCKNVGKSPTAVLQELGVSTSKLTAWKNGSAPSVAVLLLISEYYGVSVDYLIRGEEKFFIKSELTEVEQALLTDFRSLSEQGQNYVRQQMFMAKEVYKKPALFEADMKAV